MSEQEKHIWKTKEWDHCLDDHHHLCGCGLKSLNQDQMIAYCEHRIAVGDSDCEQLQAEKAELERLITLKDEALSEIHMASWYPGLGGGMTYKTDIANQALLLTSSGIRKKQEAGEIKLGGKVRLKSFHNADNSPVSAVIVAMRYKFHRTQHQTTLYVARLDKVRGDLTRVTCAIEALEQLVEGREGD